MTMLELLTIPGSRSMPGAQVKVARKAREKAEADVRATTARMRMSYAMMWRNSLKTGK